jgi:mutator protein MutT
MEELSDKIVNVVAALIYENGKLLVCRRRADAAFPLKWEFPGGKVERGESDIDALKRELREELGIEIHGATLLGRHTHSYAGGPLVSLRFYRVHAFSGEAKNLIFDTTSWVILAELEHMDFLDGDRPIIRKLLAEGESLLGRG